MNLNGDHKTVLTSKCKYMYIFVHECFIAYKTQSSKLMLLLIYIEFIIILENLKTINKNYM